MADINLVEQDIEAIKQAGGTDNDILNYLKENKVNYQEEKQQLKQSSNFSFNNKPQNKFMSYMKNAQPAFKLAVTHPETFMGKPATNFRTGQPLTPEELNQATNQDWAEIYRGANLPGSQSTKMSGQLIPQAAGLALDIATRPSSVILPKAIPAGLGVMAKNPATRRFLQTQTPTLSKWLLEANPVQPVMKEVGGMKVDITKPLPQKAEWLTKQAEKLVGAIDDTVEKVRGEYSTVMKGQLEQPLKKTFQLPNDAITTQLKNYGIDLDNLNTVGQAWEARWGLRKLISDPWKKNELFKNTSLKENDVMNLITRLKADVINSVDNVTRNKILDLDPKFETIMESGKGIKSALYNPEFGKYNTTRLVNIFKNKEDAGTRDLFRRFTYFDKRIGEVGNKIKNYNLKQTAKKWVLGAIGVEALDQYLRWNLRQSMGQNSR